MCDVYRTYACDYSAMGLMRMTHGRNTRFQIAPKSDSVELAGFEPATLCLQSPWAKHPKSLYLLGNE